MAGTRLALKLPEPAIPAVRCLATLDPSLYEALRDALGVVPPSLDPWDFARDVAKHVGQDEEKITNIAYLLTGLYSAMVVRSVGPVQMAENVLEALETARDQSTELTDEDKERCLTRLSQLLAVDASLNITSKAIEVLFQNERTYCSGRIVTDLRPVFATDPSRAPEAALIVHNLKITFHEGDRLNDFFVTLDNSDLKSLAEVLTRATQKTSSLRAVMRAADLRDLDSED